MIAASHAFAASPVGGCGPALVVPSVDDSGEEGSVLNGVRGTQRTAWGEVSPLKLNHTEPFD